MAIIDEIEKTERGIAAARAAAPGLSSYQQPVIPPPAPAAPQSAGTRVGERVRRTLPAITAMGSAVANRPVQQAETAINVGTSLPRAAGGFVRDAIGGVTGNVSPNQGQRIAPVRLPRLLTPGTPGQQTAQGAATQPGKRFVTPNPAPSRTLPAPGPVSGALSAQPTPAAAGATPSLQVGDANTFTGSNGVTRPVPGLVNAQPAPRTLPATVAATRNFASEAAGVSLTTQRNVTNNATGARDQIGAEALNGLSPTSELMRRFEISQSTMRGSPQARRMAGEAILGQIGAMNGATANGLAAANQGALDGQGIQANANEAFARRRLDADRFNVSTTENRRELDARQSSPFAQQPILRGADGSTGVLRNDGSLTPISDANGNLVRTLPEGQQPRGTVSPDVEFKALSDELANLTQMPMVEGDSRRAEILARMAQLTGQSSGVQNVDSGRPIGPPWHRQG